MSINRYHTALLHSCWLLLLASACLFYQERLYTDAAYYLFMSMNKGGFHVELNRFVLALSQIFPVLAIKAGAGANAVLLISSAGHVLFHYGISALIYHILKQRALALGVLLLQVVGLSSGYFTPVFELYYSCTLLLLLIAMLKQFKVTWAHYAAVLTIALLTFTGHPFACIVFLMLIPYCWQQSGVKHIYVILALLTLLVFVFKSYTATPYEKGKTAALMNNFQHAEYGLNYAKGLVQFLFTYYSDLLLLAGLNTLLFVYRRNYLFVFYWLAGFMALLALINLGNYGFEHTRYQEQVYFPLTVWTVVTLMMHARLWPELLTLKVLPVLGAIVITLRLWVFIPEQQRFSARIHRMQQVMEYCNGLHLRKVVISPESGTVTGGIEANWSYSIETLLLSAARNNAISICTTEDMDYLNNRHLTDDEVVLRRWDVLKTNALNEQYFSLPAGRYEPITVPPASPAIPVLRK